MHKNIIVILELIVLASVTYAQEGWYSQTSGTNSLLMDVYFTDVNTGWVVGITNTILHTTDGGDNWNPQSPPPSVNYYSVHFADSQTGCAVGATVGGAGRIRRTTDGGNTWDIITPPTSAYSLWSIYFTDANNGWIAGGREFVFPGTDPIRTIHYTSDGGYNWSTQLYQYDSLPLHDVHFVDSNTGCAVGEHGVIFWTTDGGNNWIEQTSGTVRHLWGVYLVDANTGWAVGVRGTILHTTDAGNNWIAQTADTTYGFGEIYFTDDNNGWIVGSDPDNGIVLHTTDGGNTWNSQNTGTTNGLMSIYFTDADTGWAVGNIGTILHTTTGGTGIIEDNNFTEVPANFNLTQNIPNPFSHTTTIRFSLPRAEYVILKVYNIIGQEVVTLVDSKLEAGEHKVVFNAQNLPDGVYLYQLNAGNLIQIKRCVVLK